MKQRIIAAFGVLAFGAGIALAQPAAAPKPFVAGQALGSTSDGRFMQPSANVKVFGGVVSAESCSYDSTRDLIVLPNRGAPQMQAPNDGFVSLLNHDGSVHTAKWIGATRDGLVLNDPTGSTIHNGKFYVADGDNGGADGVPRTAVIRTFDLITGAPVGAFPIPEAAFINDIAVAMDGTIYGTQTGTTDANTWVINKIAPDGKVSVFVRGAPLARPNGVAMDNAGNIVVVNMIDNTVLTFSPKAKLLKTEHAAQAGNDGLVIMPDGVKYISSVANGGVTRISPTGAAILIATGIPSAASMCLDEGGKQLVIPLNLNNAVALIKLP